MLHKVHVVSITHYSYRNTTAEKLAPECWGSLFLNRKLSQF